MNLFDPKGVLGRNLMLGFCIALPWLNPFASSPSTAVIPLLLSWMLAACALLVVVDMPLVQPPGRTVTKFAAAVLTVWLAAALVWGPEVVDRALTAGLIASLACVWLMAAVGRRAAADEGLGSVVMAALLVAAVISGVLGVLQYLGWAKDLAPWVNQPLKGDAFANLRQRNQFASLTSFGLVALLGWTAVHHAFVQQVRATRLTLWLFLNVLAAGVACSVSRTGAMQWVAVSVAFLAWAWHMKRQGKAQQTTLLSLAVSAPLLVVLWSVLMPWLALQTTGEWGASMILRITGQAQDYGMCGSRRVLWTNVLALVAQRPWLGWGWGETDFAHFMTAYDSMRFCDMLDNAHDFPLHLALEFGVPFAVVLMGCAVAWVMQRQPLREQEPSRVMAWCWLLVLAMHSLLEYPLWYGPFQMTLGLAMGWLWCTPSETSTVAPKPAAQVAPMSVAAMLFIGCLYAAWDFNRVGQIYRPVASRDAAYRDDPLHHAKQSWLFKNQAEFAELTTQTVTPENAADIFPLALRLMHYSPEARVVQRAIDSGHILGHDAGAQELTGRLEDVKKNAPR